MEQQQRDAHTGFIFSHKYNRKLRNAYRKSFKQCPSDLLRNTWRLLDILLRRKIIQSSHIWTMFSFFNMKQSKKKIFTTAVVSRKKTPPCSEASAITPFRRIQNLNMEQLVVIQFKFRNMLCSLYSATSDHLETEEQCIKEV